MEPVDKARRETQDRNGCLLQGQAYPETSQVCANEICMVCDKGEWVETEEWPGESNT